MKFNHKTYFNRGRDLIGILILLFAYELFNLKKWYWVIFGLVSVIIYVGIPCIQKIKQDASGRKRE